MLRCADETVRDESRQELATVMDKGKTVDAWAEEVLGHGVEGAVKKKKSKA